ncbi:DUF4344 domain-containing metallopeptidase [Zestomonas thermotolerans]|uniref:DUF4344 domain-containing metallopeptidase n=1 Tax=Zestomonas thermotolerans TaxID=157784 RepID=UPI0004B206C9|nr:DUF4344 domain-containing metallopeptidase [Pseudomonas thermotolerans]
MAGRAAHPPLRRLRHLLLALLLLAGPGAAEPPVPQLPAHIVRFVVANGEFTLLHEMGHMLIAELDLPVLGREEDAADQLAIMLLFLFHEDLPQAERDARMLAIVDYWRLESQRPRRVEERVPAWATHALDEQRFYNIACLVYGSDTQRLDWLPRVAGLPMERALYCDQEYLQARKALDWTARSGASPSRGRHCTCTTIRRRRMRSTPCWCARAAWTTWPDGSAGCSPCRAR